MVANSLIYRSRPVVYHRPAGGLFRQLGLCCWLFATASFAAANPTPAQLRPGVLRWLDGFRQDINLLSNRADSANWPRYRQALVDHYGLTDTLSLPNLLRPAPLYRVVGGTLPSSVFLNELCHHFVEGFQYELDTTSAVLNGVNWTGTRCLITITIPVRLHGLVEMGTRRSEITEQQTFVLAGRYEKKQLIDLRFVSLQGHQSNLNNSGYNQLTVLKLIAYQQQLLAGALTLALGDSATAASVVSRQNFERLMMSDTLWVQWDSAAPVPVRVSELRRQTMTESQLATAHIASFDMIHISRFYRDLDNQSYGEQVRLTGVCPSLEQPLLYASKNITIVRVPAGLAPNETEYVLASHVVLKLTR